MVHQDHRLSPGTQQVPAGDHALIMSVLIHDREIPMALAGHHFPDVVDVVFIAEGHQMVCLHKIADRHALVDQTGRRVCIIRRGDHIASFLLGQLLDRPGGSGPLTDDDAAGFHLDRTQLGFIAVP